MSKTMSSAPACAAANAARSAATSGWMRASIRSSSDGVAATAAPQPVAIHGAVRHRLGDEIGERRRAAPARGVEPVHRGVGVPDRHARLGEKPGGRRLAHADRAGQPEPVRPAHGASTAARSASSTSGQRPNQASKPGAA